MKKYILLLFILTQNVFLFSMKNTEQELGVWVCSFNDWLPRNIMQECNHPLAPDSLLCPEEIIKKHLIEEHGVKRIYFNDKGMRIGREYYPLSLFVKEIALDEFETLEKRNKQTSSDEENIYITFSPDLKPYSECCVLIEENFEVEDKSLLKSNKRKRCEDEDLNDQIKKVYFCQKHSKLYSTKSARRSMQKHMQKYHPDSYPQPIKKYTRYRCDFYPAILFKTKKQCKKHIRSCH